MCVKLIIYKDHARSTKQKICVMVRQSSCHRPISMTIASNFMKTYHENLNFVIIGQKYRTFYMKT